MTKLLTNLMVLSVCAALLTSCGSVKSYNFKTAGIMKGDSSYLVTESGKRIDATTIDVKPGKVTVDGKPYPLDGISSIRSKQMYFAVSDGKIYLGEVYGKINILYQLVTVTTYGSPYGYSMPGSMLHNSMVTGSSTQKKYYMQKSGSPNVDRMTVSTVLDYVADNDEALAMAQGARNWKRGYLASWAGVAVGSFLGFKEVFSTATDANGSIKPVNFTPTTIVLVASLAGMAITSTTYQIRMIKAVNIYNR